MEDLLHTWRLQLSNIKRISNRVLLLISWSVDTLTSLLRRLLHKNRHSRKNNHKHGQTGHAPRQKQCRWTNYLKSWLRLGLVQPVQRRRHIQRASYWMTISSRNCKTVLHASHLCIGTILSIILNIPVMWPWVSSNCSVASLSSLRCL